MHSVTVHRHPGPLVRPFVTAVRVAHEVDAVLVEVRDSDGRSGWGEAPTSWRVTGESAASVTAAVEGPLGAAVGLSADDPAEASAALERAVVRNSSARMAVECAVYDLAARAAGVPLFRYLGGREKALRTDMTLSAAATAAEAPRAGTDRRRTGGRRVPDSQGQDRRRRRRRGATGRGAGGGRPPRHPAGRR
jgi:L-alanine-DL-glutamate epimerase-like enolase superfamily enzyme